jgi:hypothetical protein
MRFFSSIRLVLLGVWLGAACFFIAVAQSVFALTTNNEAITREIAGIVVNRTLAILNYGGLGIGVFLLITSLIGTGTLNRAWVWIERFLLLILAGACAVGQFVIATWMMFLRGEMGGKPISEIAPDDPLLIRFGQLHQYSRWVLIVAMSAAFLAFLIIANRKFIGKDKAANATDLQNEFKF